MVSQAGATTPWSFPRLKIQQRNHLKSLFIDSKFTGNRLSVFQLRISCNPLSFLIDYCICRIRFFDICEKPESFGCRYPSLNKEVSCGIREKPSMIRIMEYFSYTLR